VPDKEFGINAEEEMHPHYYWLKKAIRQQKGQHLFPLKLLATNYNSEEKMKLLQDKFNI